MKPFFSTYILLVLLILVAAGKLQAQQPGAVTRTKEQLAYVIASRMKDSLGLSGSQQEKLYQVNLQLAEQKLAVRRRYTQADSIAVHTQVIENTRDSLYRQVLGEGRYTMYLQKKTQLVKN